MPKCSNRVLKNPPFTPFDKLRTGFDKLRANGGGLKIVGDFPFVLSLSKHESDFFSSLLEQPQIPADELLAKKEVAQRPERKEWTKGDSELAITVTADHQR